MEPNPATSHGDLARNLSPGRYPQNLGRAHLRRNCRCSGNSSQYRSLSLPLRFGHAAPVASGQRTTREIKNTTLSMREPEKKRFDPSAEEGHAELEARLRRVQPAALPVELTRKLLAAHPASKPHRRRPVFQKSASHIFLPLLRWLMPAMAVLTVAAVVGRLTLVKTRVPGKLTTAAQEAPLKADDVQIDHELVS